MYSKRELLNWLWELGDGVDSPPSQADLNTNGGAPSPGTYHRRFESWQTALLEAGFSNESVNDRYPDSASAGVKYTNSDLLTAIQDTANKLGRTPTRDEFAEMSEPGPTTVAARFGSWNIAVSRAGLDPVKEHEESDKYTDEELLEIIRQVSLEIGSTPSFRDIRRFDWTPSTSTYQRRFGSWSKARRKALEHRNDE